MATTDTTSSAHVFDIDRWESYFTTRDGALQDVAAMRASASWRWSTPVRGAGQFARTARARLTGHPLPRFAPGTAAEALDRRLRLIAPYILTPTGPAKSTAFSGATAKTLAAATAAELENVPVEELIERTSRAATGHPDRAWLLFTGLAGAMPTDGELTSFLRALTRTGEASFMEDILRLCAAAAVNYHSQLCDMEVVTERPFVFVDYVARYPFNSGVQRTTREFASRWKNHGALFVAMTRGTTSFRALEGEERNRVLDWNSSMYRPAEDMNWLDYTTLERDRTVLVPWNTTVVIPEIPARAQLPALTTLAHHSNNTVAVYAYDALPITSRSMFIEIEAEKFIDYLAMVRYCDRVVTDSETTAKVFAGFVSGLATQGVTGPVVDYLLLPVVALPESDSTDAILPDSSGPLVLTVGSNAPHKNVLSIMYAAERLWREGHRFTLLIMGGQGRVDLVEVRDCAAALKTAGRDIHILHDVTDEKLAAAYRQSRFTVFLSTDEGFGLPVAESLAAGTPVLATKYGSVAEIAAGGGTLAVDPRDDDDILAGFRTLLSNDAELERLRAEIAQRPISNWDRYANELWAKLLNTTPPDSVDSVGSAGSDGSVGSAGSDSSVGSDGSTLSDSTPSDSTPKGQQQAQAKGQQA